MTGRILVVDDGFELEAKNRLGRIGFDRVVGFLADPLAVMSANPDRVQRASRRLALPFVSDPADFHGVVFGVIPPDRRV